MNTAQKPPGRPSGGAERLFSALLCAMGLVAMLLAGNAIARGQTAPNQKSNLDEAAEEEPPLTTPKKPDTRSDSGAANKTENSSQSSQPGAAKPPVEEEEEAPLAQPPKVQPGTSLLDDLAGQAGAAGEEGAEVLEGELPCDIVQYVVRGDLWRPRHIKLLPKYLSVPLPASQVLVLQRMSVTGESYFPWRVSGGEIGRIDYYEQRMLERAAGQLAGISAAQLSKPGALFDLASPRQAAGAQRAIALLTLAISQHDSFVQRNLRQGQDWLRFREPLVQAQWNLQLSQVHLLIQQGRSGDALVACDRLLESIPRHDRRIKELRSWFEKLLLTPAEQELQAEKYQAARDLLEQYLARFPISPGERGEKFREALIALARRKLAEARTVPDTTTALALLDQAASIWPGLAEVEQVRSQRIARHPILECTYTSLPNNLSPLSARSPVERQAASLMFESLVRWAGDHYEPQLAEGRPLPLARGRQFFLPAGAVWSDSPEGAPYYCTAEDVIWTLKLFDRLHPPGYSRSWAALFDVPKDAPRDGESFSVALKVVRDHWAPLSLMDFPILPSHRFPKLGSDPAEIAAFNAQPTGSGPYVFRERTTDPEKVVFAANPHYRRLGLPRIREVAFNRADFVGESGSVKMLLQGRLHLIYDVPSSVLQELEGAAGASLCRVHKLRRPEVCFLAPNYRRPKMQNASLRLAIAHAIHRKQILDQYFRGTRPGDHAELTGPYPRDSWAYDAEVPPFDPALASVHLAKARQELSLDGEVSLSLACPGRDPDIAQACTQIANALAPLGIKLTVQAVEPDQFHEMIYQRFPFDLVYWRHEFPNETYWLWPLVDPNEIGPQGANFMAYRPQPDLLGMFNHLKTHKAFAEIRATTHDIHAYFARHAVVIPLWQLDTYVAVHRLVRIPSGTLDPMAPLSGIEHWTLSSK